MLSSAQVARFAWAVLLFYGGAANAQEPVEIAPDQVQAHRIGRQSLIHSKTPLPFGNDHVDLQVIVDATGKVESARCVSGPEEFCSKAQNLELKQAFKPFEQDGSPTPVSFVDAIYIMPLEKWAEASVPFPEIVDWNTLKIGLKRTRCFGPCPSYSVEVHADGEVNFDGEAYVLITGRHQGKVARQTVEALVNEFKKANYFSLKSEYVFGVTDHPTYTTFVEFDGNRKTVRDYVGLRAGMPEVVAQLEAAIDQTAGTEKWVTGNEQTGPSLLAEKWNFRSESVENRALFANITARRSEELIRLFLANGAPIGLTTDGASALVSAAEQGNLELVKLLLDAQAASPSLALLSCALGAAAQRGGLPLIRFLIEHGANPNGPLCGPFEKETVLLAAARSGKVEPLEEILKYHPDTNAKARDGSSVLALFVDRNGDKGETQRGIAKLLAYHVDVNDTDNSGRTPIFNACSSGNTEAIRILVEAGADLNVKDKNGQTVLMSCLDPSALKVIISAGADLTVRGPNGQTAAEQARQVGFHDKAELLESTAGVPEKQ